MLLKIVKLLVCIPKTIYYNLYYFNIKEAIKLPMLVSYDCKIIGKRGSITINKNVKTFMIRLGYNKGSFNISEKKKTYIEIKDSSNLKFCGKATISKGSYICLNKKARITLGDNFSCNANCLISSQESIYFGSDCLVGWNCTIIDGDGHSISKNRKSKTKNDIIIGNHVWIGANTTILKGSTIKNNCIVGLGSVVSSKFNEDNILIVSEKAKKNKGNINWEK